jgi:pimeloyl-ACP methyl ester carboxylesterase
MTTELVHVTTSDGLRLDGALHTPDDARQPTPATGHAAFPDAFLLLHGTGSNFYGSALFAAVIPNCIQLGAVALAVNTRGHDLAFAATTASGRRMFGAAYEMVDECRLDVAAWLALLGGRGFRRIALVGHSLGAVKAVYFLAHETPPMVCALVAISPPQLSHSHFLRAPWAKHFKHDLATAETHVREGRGDALMAVQFPLPYLVTAAGYTDKYGPAEHYNILKYVERIAVPALFTFGTIELAKNVAFAGLPELLDEQREPAGRLRVVVVAGADHFYSGVQGELMRHVERWLQRILT